MKTWYRIVNLAKATDVHVYDEIGAFGITARDFISDLSAVQGPVVLHLNSPGGEVFDGLAIYNALKANSDVTVLIEGIAASIATVIAMAASPGKLGIAKRASMMIHDGFSQATGNAADMRDLAELLDKQSDQIAGVYSDRTGQPSAYWRTQMQKETWFTGDEAVAAGLADYVIDMDNVQATWKNPARFVHAPETVLAYGKIVSMVKVSPSGAHAATSGSHNHVHGAYGTQGGDNMHSHDHTHDNDASHGHHAAGSSANEMFQCPKCSAESMITARYCAQCGKNLRKAQARLSAAAAPPAKTDGGDGWVADDKAPGGYRFDPDGDGDDDSTPEGDTDHDYFDADGKPIPGKTIPPKPKAAVTDAASGSEDDDDSGKKAPFPGAATPFKKKKKAAAQSDANFMNADSDFDQSPWDGGRAMSAGADADDPAAFYAGICAGRRAGDPALQSSWALPYKFSPKAKPNAAAVRNALARIGQTQGLTNKAQAQSLLDGLMKKMSPDSDASDLIDPLLLQSMLTVALGRE